MTATSGFILYSFHSLPYLENMRRNNTFQPDQRIKKLENALVPCDPFQKISFQQIETPTTKCKYSQQPGLLLRIVVANIVM
jgi:hypothetical protein